MREKIERFQMTLLRYLGSVCSGVLCWLQFLSHFYLAQLPGAVSAARTAPTHTAPEDFTAQVGDWLRKGFLGCNPPLPYCFCVDFTLRVNNTRVSDRLYLYGQESCLLSGSPSATKFTLTLTCFSVLAFDSGPAQVLLRWLCLSRRDTWLILPVVICLSQRLSHACLSTSLIKVKPRMAH